MRDPIIFDKYEPMEPFERQVITRWDLGGKIETDDERKIRMLRQISLTCSSCTMCSLGTKDVEEDKSARDPHVFSNMNISKYMIVGQNPGFNEVVKRKPFVGKSGETFDDALRLNDLSRDSFYITNTVKCYTDKNRKPTSSEIDACESFLKMEILLLKPSLLIVFGSVAFDRVCGNSKSFQESLGDIVESKYGVNTYVVYHPSPLNLSNLDRRAEFYNQIKKLAKLMKAMG